MALEWVANHHPSTEKGADGDQVRRWAERFVIGSPRRIENGPDVARLRQMGCYGLYRDAAPPVMGLDTLEIIEIGPDGRRISGG